MTKKLFFSAALALTLAGGAVATTTSIPAVAAASAGQAVSAAPIAAVAVAQDAAAVQLTAAQMATVQGAGLFSFISDIFKEVRKKIVGWIATVIFNLFKSWVSQIWSSVDGGQKQQQTQIVTENYNSQSDYDNGIVASTTTEETPWVVTESWGGSSGCGGGGREGLNYVQDIQAESVSTC